MKITINGQLFELASNNTLTGALQEFGAKEPYAVALNGQFVPRDLCHQTAVKQGDNIELLSPIQGG